VAVDVVEGPVGRQQTLLLARMAEATSVPYKLHYRNGSSTRPAEDGASSGPTASHEWAACAGESPAPSFC
jgi:hypothetical protein